MKTKVYIVVALFLACCLFGACGEKRVSGAFNRNSMKIDFSFIEWAFNQRDLGECLDSASHYEFSEMEESLVLSVFQKDEGLSTILFYYNNDLMDFSDLYKIGFDSTDIVFPVKEGENDDGHDIYKATFYLEKVGMEYTLHFSLDENNTIYTIADEGESGYCNIWDFYYENSRVESVGYSGYNENYDYYKSFFDNKNRAYKRIIQYEYSAGRFTKDDPMYMEEGSLERIIEYYVGSREDGKLVIDPDALEEANNAKEEGKPFGTEYEYRYGQRNHVITYNDDEVKTSVAYTYDDSGRVAEAACRYFNEYPDDYLDGTYRITYNADGSVAFQSVLDDGS